MSQFAISIRNELNQFVKQFVICFGCPESLVCVCVYTYIFYSKLQTPKEY